MYDTGLTAGGDNMDFDHLRYFAAVAQTLNFSEAARQNGVPQPKISRSIFELETELGVPLFSRTKRDVFLTREGAAYLPYAVDMLETSQKAAFMVEQIHSGRTGSLSVATVSTTGHILAGCLSVFAQRYPEILVDITQNTGRAQAQAMLENRYDFHFAHFSMLPEDGRLDYVVTHTDKLVLVVPKGYELARKKLDIPALFNERFIMISQPESPQLHSQIMDIFAAHHTVPKVVQRYDKAESVLLSVGSGLGVSILPLGLTKAFLPDAVDVVPLDISGAEIVYVCAWAKKLANPSSKLFLEVVQGYFSNDRGNI